MANIREVAALAGVSISSVSNVLNGRVDQMRSETRARIEQAIGELNYQPNRIIAQPKKRQPRMFGLLVPSIVNPSFAALAHEVELAARKQHYRMLLGSAGRREEEEAEFIEDLFSQGVRGLIVAASDLRKTHFARAAEQGMVIINYDNRQAWNFSDLPGLYDSISMDNAEAGRIAAAHLLERGCRNIVFATEASLTPGRSLKIDGFQTVLRQHQMESRGQVVEEKAAGGYGDSEMSELGYALAARILRISPRPDGIVAVNDALGIGLIAGLRDAGAAVPEEISVIGIDNVPLSRMTRPAMSSVMAPLGDIASLMVERLLQRIADPRTPPEEFLFTPSLEARQSVREAGP